jgi:subtilisin inhibitor-like
VHIAAVISAALAFAQPAQTSLTITVWPQGLKGPSSKWTLRCRPTGGTLPKRSAACTRLYSTKAPFASIPPHTMCSDVYGGPQVAHVNGVYRGRRIATTFARRNGCETARWDKVAFLFPGATS